MRPRKIATTPKTFPTAPIDATRVNELTDCVRCNSGERPDSTHGQCLAGLDGRSEEHTSELQSRVDLVCRLLLEKKKVNRTFTITSSKTLKNSRLHTKKFTK